MDDAYVRAHLRSLPSPAMPADVRAGVLASLPQEGTVVPLTATHQRRIRTLLVAAVAAGVLALAGLASGPHRTQTPVASPVMHAGALYEPDDFAALLSQRYLTAPPTDRPTGTFADSPEGISGCTRAISAFGRLLGIDVGTYNRAAAVVLVTTYPASKDYEEVWVVAPTCGPANAAIMRHMLYDVDHSTATL